MLATAVNAPAQAGPSAPVVTSPAGTVSGSSFDGGDVFYNIPFARPPIGQLRWRSPQPVLPAKAPRDARAPGATCIQPDQVWNSVDASRSNEDCLYLNIWRPRDSKRLPVMVWFHGGAFVGGAGNTPLYDGQVLAGSGVVLITVNYRLGVFGYLAHPQLSGESPHGVSGNYGLLDQIEALRWVQDNVEAFGGDSRSITIFGQSAGAASVGFLLAAPEAKGLFNRAILQSGAPYGIMLGRAPRLAQAQAANRALGNIAELRALPAREVMARWNDFARSEGEEGLRLSPIVDGFVLPRMPAELFAQGMLAGRSIMTGHNSREIPAALTDAMTTELAKKTFGGNAPAVLATYAARAEPLRHGSVADQLMTDLMFGCGSRQLAATGTRAWLYEFAQPSPGEPAVRHSSELPYVFGNANKDDGVLSTRPFNSSELGLSRTVITYWTNFARSGDPNGAGVPHWPRYSAKGGSNMQFGAGNATAGRMASAVCDMMQIGRQ